MVQTLGAKSIVASRLLYLTNVFTEHENKFIMQPNEYVKAVKPPQEYTLHTIT